MKRRYAIPALLLALLVSSSAFSQQTTAPSADAMAKTATTATSATTAASAGAPMTSAPATAEAPKPASTAKAEAADYLAFLRSSAAKSIFEKYGFPFLVSPTT